MDPITILIADDHKLVREAWSLILNKDERFKVVAECSSAESVIETVKTLVPAIVLLDISLPGMSGIEAVPIILQASPSSKIIGISQHAVPEYALKMMQQGAAGYVTKSSSKEEMIEAILAVHSGKNFICQYIKELMAEQFMGGGNPYKAIKTLSQRELEIIELIKEGMSSVEIAKQLSITAKTVEVHRHNILKKLNLKNTPALINFISKY